MGSRAKINGLSDGDRQLLVDWRADAARPFYAATPVHPMGLRRRRHLGLDGSRVVRVSDEILDVDLLAFERGDDATRRAVVDGG